MFRRVLRLQPAVSQQCRRNMSMVGDAKQAAEYIKKNNLPKIIMYAKTELTPPTPAEIPRAIRDGIRLFRNPGNWRNVTVREAWLNTLVTIEVVCWFFVGECIGKGNIVGYQV